MVLYKGNGLKYIVIKYFDKIKCRQVFNSYQYEEDRDRDVDDEPVATLVAYVKDGFPKNCVEAHFWQSYIINFNLQTCMKVRFFVGMQFLRVNNNTVTRSS